MNKKDILVCITNHNSNENAIKLKEEFSKYFDTIIIDSKSDTIEEEFDVKIDNLFYTGLFNESIKQTKLRGKKYCYFIASDVFIEDYEKIPSIIETLGDDIYLWAPSTRGQSHTHCKNAKSGNYREVPYLEGFTFLAHINLCDGVYPVSLKENLYGYGIDLTLGYTCIKKMRKKCVVDDRVEVYHKEGTGYDQGKALNDMYKWMISSRDDNFKYYTFLYSRSPGWVKLLEFLKNNI